MVVKVNVVVFWSMKTCSFVDRYQTARCHVGKKQTVLNLEFMSQMPVFLQSNPVITTSVYATPRL
jgi:hypothetical protein